MRPARRANPDLRQGVTVATGSTHAAACPPRTATSPALSSPSRGPHSAPKSVSQLARTTPRPSGTPARGSEADEGARVPASAPVESRDPPPGARRPLRSRARGDDATGDSSRFEGEGRRGRRGDSAGDPRKRWAGSVVRRLTETRRYQTPPQNTGIPYAPKGPTGPDPLAERAGLD